MLLLLTSCVNHHDNVIGKWHSSASSFNAVYEIFSGEEGLDCKVVSYHDGTSSYASTRNAPIYLFKSANKRNGVYLDGTTGAAKNFSAT